MGLFRLAAVVAIGVSLLPADREKQEQLYQRAADAATWTLTFCDRNQATCEKAEALWVDFAAKAQFGAKLAYDAFREGEAASGTATEKRIAPAAYRLEPPRRHEMRGTLRPSDLQPKWRGKSAPDKGI